MHPLTDHTVQSFDNVPEELVLRILRNVPADDVHSNVGSTSKRLRRIAQDAPLWEALCSEILTENSVNALSCARFDREIWCPSSSQTTLFEFWGLYLRYWAPRLGWWLDASESTDKKSSDGTFVSSILADLASGVIVFQHLYLRAGMHRPGHNVNELLEDLPQNVERPEIFLGAIRIFGHLPTNNRWDVQLMHAELAQVDVIASLWDEHSKQNHSFSREVGVSSPLSLAPRVLTTDLDIGTLVRPFPKSLTSVVKLVDKSPSTRLSVRSLHYGDDVYWQLYSPRLSNRNHGPVHPGWYAGWYAGTRLCGLFFVHISDIRYETRQLLNATLGALNELGDRCIEVVSLRGPHSSLQIAIPILADAKPVEAQTKMTRHPLMPWPIDEEHVKNGGPSLRSMSQEKIDQTSVYGIARRGLDYESFVSIRCHFASRDEFQVLWAPPYSQVGTYKRLEL